MYGNWLNPIPSRFVEELPEEHIETGQESGMHSAGRSKHWDSSGFTPHQKPKSDLPLSGMTMTNFVKPSTTGIAMGDIIRHATFGEGRVIHVAGSKLDIRFKDGSTKRLLDSFVEKLFFS